MRRLLCASLLIPTAACLFAERDDGLLLCGADADCPDGKVCDASAHLCRGADETLDTKPPAVLNASASPAFAAAGATVTITVETDEDIVTAQLLPAPGSGALVFDGPGDNARALAFDVVIADSTFEGAYAIDAIALTDAAGNAVERPLAGVGFVVDRTAPAAVSVNASVPDPSGIAADGDAVQIALLATEPLVSVGARFQDLLDAPTACVPEATQSQGYLCTLTVPPSLSSGPTDVLLELTDRAGNLASVEVPVQVDTSAPQLVGALTALIRDADGDVAPVLTPSGSVSFSFAVDEPLGVIPEVKITIGAQVFNMVVTPTFGAYAATLDSPAFTDASEDTAALNVTLIDRFGHRADLTPQLANLPLGIPVSASAPSTCEHPAPAACPDQDGDGQIGLDTDCDPQGQQSDCDDEDATTYHGAIEIPADGKDNDCLDDGDGTFDDENFVFIRCADGGDFEDCSDGFEPTPGTGTRASPYQDFDVALQAVTATPRTLVASGVVAYPFGTLITVPTTVLGGYNADDGWLRVPPVDGAPLVTTLHLTGAHYLLLGGGADLSTFDAELTVAPGASVIRSSGGGNINLASGTRAVGSSIGSVQAIIGATDVRVVGGSYSSVTVNSGAEMAVSSASIGRFIVFGAFLELVNVDAAGEVSGGLARVWHSQLGSVYVNGGRLEAVNTIIDPPLNTPALVVCTECAGSTEFALAGVALADNGAGLVELQEVGTVTLAELQACAGVYGCAGASGLEQIAPGGTPGQDGPDPFALGAPPSAVADGDGACRPGGDGKFTLGRVE